MKKYNVIIAVLLCILVLDTSCQAQRRVRGSGPVTTEEHRIRDVRGVKLTTFGDLFIKIGNREHFEIEAQENLHEYFTVEVTRGLLVIGTERWVNMRTDKPVRYYLTVRDLERIELTSSGDAEAPDIEAEHFLVRLSSSGDLSMGDLQARSVEIIQSSSGEVDMGDLFADRLEVSLSSSGDLHITGGEVTEQQIRLSSSGTYRAGRLACEKARVSVSSSGSATVRVSDYLHASTSSSGSINYIGDPEVTSRRSSSGRIRRIERP